jgi:hypothetical protein
MEMHESRKKKEQIERAIGQALISWLEKENPKFTTDEIMHNSVDILDCWEIKGSSLSEEKDVLRYSLIVERPGLVIGQMGKQIDFLIKESKRLLGFDYEFHLQEQKKSHLYDIALEWFSMQMMSDGCL